jgi:hypothetical protein
VRPVAMPWALHGISEVPLGTPPTPLAKPHAWPMSPSTNSVPPPTQSRRRRQPFGGERKSRVASNTNGNASSSQTRFVSWWSTISGGGTTSVGRRSTARRRNLAHRPEVRLHGAATIASSTAAKFKSPVQNDDRMVPRRPAQFRLLVSWSDPAGAGLARSRRLPMRRAGGVGRGRAWRCGPARWCGARWCSAGWSPGRRWSACR